MEKPLALKVISIILIVLGVVRLLGGIAGYSIGAFENINLSIVIFFENFVCGILLLISGIMLLKGNKTGRILFIVASIIPLIAYIIFLKMFNRGFIIHVILVLLLYLLPSIKDYFNNKEEL